MLTPLRFITFTIPRPSTYVENHLVDMVSRKTEFFDSSLFYSDNASGIFSQLED